MYAEANLARLRRALEAPMFSSLRRQLMLREAVVEDRFVREIASRSQKSVYDYRVLKQRFRGKSDETFYVLGSGSSVEDLSLSEFSLISKCVSVGVNAWALHDFVPDIYSFEPVPFRNSDHFKTMSLLNRLEVFNQSSAIMFLKPRTPVEVEQLRLVPPELASRVMLYGRFQPFTRDPANLKNDFKIIRSLAGRSLSVLPDSGASIIRMAFLAVLLGFSRIVFVGVDLNHTEYFWERNPEHLRRRGLRHFSSGQLGPTHETLNNDTRAFGVIEMLRALRDYGQVEGFALEVANPNSLLAEFLPVHNFSLG